MALTQYMYSNSIQKTLGLTISDLSKTMFLQLYWKVKMKPRQHIKIKRLFISRFKYFSTLSKWEIEETYISYMGSFIPRRTKLCIHLQIEFTSRDWLKTKADAKIFPRQGQLSNALIWINCVASKQAERTSLVRHMEELT